MRRPSGRRASSLAYFCEAPPPPAPPRLPDLSRGQPAARGNVFFYSRKCAPRASCVSLKCEETRRDADTAVRCSALHTSPPVTVSSHRYNGRVVRFTGDDRTGGTGCWGRWYGTGYNGGDWVVPCLAAFSITRIKGASCYTSTVRFSKFTNAFCHQKWPLKSEFQVKVRGQRILDNPSLQSNTAVPFINSE